MLKIFIKIKTLEKNNDAVSCLVVLPDGSLASGSHNRKIIIWDIKSGNEIKTLSAHTRPVNSLVVLPDGSFI